MKTELRLEKNWELKQIAPTALLEPGRLQEDRTGWLAIEQMPAQVQDVLLAHRRIPEEFLVGWCEQVNWITEYDWVYRLEFARPKEREGQRARLIFQGLDTYADLYLNGRRIGAHDNFYLPQEAEVTELLQEENCLLIHFHRVCDVLEAHPLKEEWKGQIMPCKMLRKPVHDFDPGNEWGSEYQGAVPYFSAVGVYRDVLLQYFDEEEIELCDVAASADEQLDGRIALKLQGSGEAGKLEICYALLDREGRTVLAGELLPKTVCAKERLEQKRWAVCEELTLEAPHLWQPNGHGDPYLYTLRLTLTKKGEVREQRTKRIGFKRVEVLSPLEFVINKKRVRLWGGSLDPLQGYTHCFIRERAERLFEMILNAHFNTLRIWGEGIPYPDEFYDMADEKGILIWQEFFLGWGPVPDSEEYVEEYRKEARTLILRLRYHAGLLMWCGGNESMMAAEMNFLKPYGKRVFLEVFPKLVEELDPGRYYHPNSPWFGNWSDDPREGDHHTYDAVWQYPYLEYANFISEHCRTAPPVLHSLKRMIKGPVFPEGYNSLQTPDTELIMPKNWLMRSSIGSKGQRKSGPYWTFYDADNAEDMVYRFAASAAGELRRLGEQIRRGSRLPADASHRSKGYLTCKLLDTWPKIYCSTIDFFQEGYLPYYTVARMFTPVMVSFAKEESIKLWIVNDSDETFRGRVTLDVYNIVEETYFRRDSFAVETGPADAGIVFDLEQYRFIPIDCVLAARLEDETGAFVYEAVEFLDVERNLRFKDTELEVRVEGRTLVIRAAGFVRCVEILGNCDGDPFGWLFGDNYFDLMPGEERRVHILGQKEHGEISVKGHYMKKAVTVEV